MSRVSTAYLLTCAAIGVAGGVLLWGATALSTLLFAVVPFISVAIAGLWLLPAVVALTLVSCLAGTALGIFIADRLRGAGVARLARRRPKAEQEVLPAA